LSGGLQGLPLFFCSPAVFRLLLVRSGVSAGGEAFLRLVEYQYTLIEKRCKLFLSKNDKLFPIKNKAVAMPHRKLTPGRLVLATHNAGKVREIKVLVGPFGIEPVAAGEIGLAAPAETETTFLGNATIKARAAAAGSGLPALADDSGLAVAALGGAPGVYSADWAEAEGGRDFGRAMARVEAELAALPGAGRRARFICCLALAWPDGHLEAFEGAVCGRLVFPPRGGRGFGYDPIFVADGETKTFGEMEPARKHAMSHRADAFAKLVAACLR
jgi:XTP/dITP diphosphohydrolase